MVIILIIKNNKKMLDGLFKQVESEVERKYGRLAVAIEYHVKNYTPKQAVP